MRTLRVACYIGLIGTVAVIGSLSLTFGFLFWVNQDNLIAASNELTAQDYAEIQQLYGRYNEGADFRDSDLFLSAFADDARFRAGSIELVGTEELAAWRVERHGGETGDTGRRHWNSSSYRITPSPEGADGRVYWLLVDVSGGQPQTVGSGYYNDEYVKTSDGWRFKSRVVMSDAR